MNRQWSFLVLALAAVAPGCGPDIAALCEEQEACLGGNDADIDACEVAFEGIRDNAYDIGCGEEYDLLIECFTPQYDCIGVGSCSTSDECIGSTCNSGECKSYGVDSSNADACEAEVNAYSRCD